MTVRPWVGDVGGNREREGWSEDKRLRVGNTNANENGEYRTKGISTDLCRPHVRI